MRGMKSYDENSKELQKGDVSKEKTCVNTRAMKGIKPVSASRTVWKNAPSLLIHRPWVE